MWAAGKVWGTPADPASPAECGLADGWNSSLSTAAWRGQNGQPAAGNVARGGNRNGTRSLYRYNNLLLYLVKGNVQEVWSELQLTSKLKLSHFQYAAVYIYTNFAILYFQCLFSVTLSVCFSLSCSCRKWPYSRPAEWPECFTCNLPICDLSGFNEWVLTDQTITANFNSLFEKLWFWSYSFLVTT